MLSTPVHSFNLALDFMLLLVFAGLLVTGRYRRRHQAVDSNETSALLAYYTGSARLLPVAEGHMRDMPYSALLIMNTELSGGGRTALLYQAALPFSSKIHLLGIPKKSGAVQLNPTTGGGMEKVELEGDFDDYFSIFCGKGMQVDARYVLDPEAMEFVVEFCRSYNWEIVGNELYFLASGTGAKDDNTDMFADITKFVEQIRPAVATPLSDAERRAITPYGEDLRKDLKCPVCSAVMTNAGDYFQCPEGHGVLVSGRYLREVMREPRSKYAAGVEKAPSELPEALTCPSCGTKMNHVAYDFSDIEIDSCPNCPYRWLDTAEVRPGVLNTAKGLISDQKA